MIMEERNLEIYGYTSAGLGKGSDKPIIVMCDGCGSERILSNERINRLKSVGELCGSCMQIGRKMSQIAIGKMISSKSGHKPSSEARKNMAKGQMGRKHSQEARERNSAGQQGQDYDAGEWTGFATSCSNDKYCSKFDNEIRKFVRDKYNNCDYISGIPATICNSGRKLDVHHVDYNKNQGCDGHEWRLIPLSVVNHARTRGNRDFWNRLFTYSLQYDEAYYDECMGVAA